MEKNKLLQVIKIGSACLFNKEGNIDYDLLKERISEIESDKNHNILVVSGAIALGIILAQEHRSKEELSAVELQGYASAGQIYLMDLYKSLFTKTVAQILVTEKEINQKDSIRKLILENIAKNRITLINYNDCLDFEEIRKDNDTLAGDILFACNADRLIVFGKDYDGFKDDKGNLIEKASIINEKLYGYCNGKSKLGNGGFKTKLDVAKKIIEANKEMIISSINYNFEDIILGKVRRTVFKRHSISDE